MSRKEELKKYLREVANPVIESLVTDILKTKPRKKDLPAFCKKWFEGLLERRNENPVSSDDESDAEPVERTSFRQQASKGKGRAGVSAEVYGEYNKKEDFHPRVIPKSEDTKKRILLRLKESFLFRSLEEKETDIVIDAMEEKNFKGGETIITQGEDGDVLYVVDQGELDCFKKFKEGPEKHLKVYLPGEAFGELALLYNAPRAATIRCKKDSTLFALDRLTFNNIVKDAAQKRRKIYEEVLKEVELLQEMDPYERNQIADVLKDVNVSANEYVIKEGDSGDKFYIVVKGALAATKKDAEGH